VASAASFPDGGSGGARPAAAATSAVDDLLGLENEISAIQVRKFPSVAKGPKFQPQSSKRAEKKFVGPGKSKAELLPDLSKKGQKGAEFFWFGFP
jgi:hypothetical protein